MDCLEGINAWKAAHDPEIGGSLKAEQLLELMKAAGYSEETSQKTASQRALERLRKDLEP